MENLVLRVTGYLVLAPYCNVRNTIRYLQEMNWYENYKEKLRRKNVKLLEYRNFPLTCFSLNNIQHWKNDIKLDFFSYFLNCFVEDEKCL